MNKRTISVGLMLFALFFGAGNLIFPPQIGQSAGQEFWSAMVGFFITGVGLPLLAIIAMAVTGGGLKELTDRVHPVFGLVFPFILYLAIGPLFGIPRTGNVAYEMGVVPFLSEKAAAQPLPLFLVTCVFFGVTYWLCLNPSKLVDRIGNILTPALLIIIGVIMIKAFIDPIGAIGSTAEAYRSSPMTKGFMDGYLTMDTLGALAFGIVVINAVKQNGVSERLVTGMVIKAGLIAGFCLAAVYFVLAYLGATSQSLGAAENGGEILTNVVYELFGASGNVLLGAAVILACLTTSIGLVTACAQFAAKALPGLSYKNTVLIISVFSLAVANIGLNQLIAVSVPVLTAIYPLAIVLIILSLFHQRFKGRAEVYQGALLLTAAVSAADGLKAAGINIGVIEQMYSAIPLYAEGIGWLIPALLGACIGYGITLITSNSKLKTEN
ncbi:branched-chain amino acid transport system II carrier protein [Fictibacillus aquaticus]|uniref:Branched-chain amino acid transport system carrier protein n=1 Tax=Fictibacillus aquaticus TaxID=2021314 RepID=A0A235F584_9BACL|nr:branched-chain amino acid transport system II carrier protein [Fictibacillus aquaticus]OYD56253.1 branched-chain amino acid transport system II carrier protein [Fictibacillus aquaticus]